MHHLRGFDMQQFCQVDTLDVASDDINSTSIRYDNMLGNVCMYRTSIAIFE